jgi:hypothetical protein
MSADSERRASGTVRFSASKWFRPKEIAFDIEAVVEERLPSVAVSVEVIELTTNRHPAALVHVFAPKDGTGDAVNFDLNVAMRARTQPNNAVRFYSRQNATDIDIFGPIDAMARPIGSKTVMKWFG